MNLEKIYICHWKQLKERKDKLLQLLDYQGIENFTFIESYDKNDWNLTEIKSLYPYAFQRTPSGRFLNEPEISLLLKHYSIISEMSISDNPYALVLEDDVIFCDDFLINLEKSCNQLPKDWDLVWAGTCCNLHSKYIPGKYVYKENSSRCTHAYLISKQGANKILNNISKITEAIDHSYNFFIKTLNLNNYWIEPALVIQDPNYKTTIQIDK